MRQEKTREALNLLDRAGILGSEIVPLDAAEAEIAEWENHRARADRIEALARRIVKGWTEDEYWGDTETHIEALAAALGEGQDSAA